MFAYGESDGTRCDSETTSPCDSYVKLFVNGAFIVQTPTIANTLTYDVNYRYMSEKIAKSSKIVVEVWDDDDPTGVFGSPDDLILRSEGSIDNFLDYPFRDGPNVNLASEIDGQNSINTYTFWQDEYE